MAQGGPKAAAGLGVHARTLGFSLGAWGAYHPVRYTAPYLGSARRPRMHHARTLGFSVGAWGGPRDARGRHT